MTSMWSSSSSSLLLPPAPAPAQLSVTLASVAGRKGKPGRLELRIPLSGRGVRELMSPFQAPAFTRIRASGPGGAASQAIVGDEFFAIRKHIHIKVMRRMKSLS
jgi:hypothetical protein